jgi:hypothetical protein
LDGASVRAGAPVIPTQVKKTQSRPTACTARWHGHCAHSIGYRISGDTFRVLKDLDSFVFADPAILYGRTDHCDIVETGNEHRFFKKRR